MSGVMGLYNHTLNWVMIGLGVGNCTWGYFRVYRGSGNFWGRKVKRAGSLKSVINRGV